MDVFDVYVALWERARCQSAWVHYYTWYGFGTPKLTSDPEGASGWFESNVESGGDPHINLYRLECDDDAYTPSRTRGPEGASLPPPDLVGELITLAHEYGHLMSFRGRTPRAEWDRYTETANRRAELSREADEASDGLSGDEKNDRIRRAVWAGLTDDDRNRIVAEEALAWKIGREVLTELGFDDFQRFDKRERWGLHRHRHRLGMEEAWPGADVGAIE